MAVKKADLVQRLARQFPGIRMNDAREMIDLFLESMREGLGSGDTVELRDFGVFRVRTRSSRKARNPRTGVSVIAVPKKIPYFRQSRILKAHLKK